MPDLKSQVPCTPRETGAEPQPVRRLSSAELLGDGRELIIDHGPEQYRLRKTRLGKLILTK